MHSRLPRFVALGVCALSITGVTAFAQTLTKSSAEKRSELERRYESLANLAPPDRRIAVVEMQPAEQDALWSIHINRFLADHPDLTVEQRSIVFEALGLVTAGVIQRISSGKADEVRKGLDELAQLEFRAKTVLRRDLARALLAEIGPPQPDEPLRSASRLRITPLNTSCNCNIISDYCWFGDCMFGSDQCTRQPWGCGTFFQDPCNGLCP